MDGFTCPGWRMAAVVWMNGPQALRDLAHFPSSAPRERMACVYSSFSS